ncbi:hypothetical protein ACH42_04085 [Endozoicomonas sp. (ex Bugula neritina AB1)]|nr:hypothetical protein ACH42_04085 [Endozoicomonas sp. (ex Bugula neritina AB1)]
MNNTSLPPLQELSPQEHQPQDLLQALCWIKQTPNLFTAGLSPYFVGSAIPGKIELPDLAHPALQSLAGQLNQKHHVRLGIYYEHLWHLLLRHHSGTELLAHNLPVRAAEGATKTTLGEYDLIYQRENQVYHRELAVKFYLGVPLDDMAQSHTSLHHWVGPGLKDRMDLKLERMLNHQIALSDHGEGAKALLDLGINHVEKEILVQGRLFYPLNGNCPPPKYTHQNHLKGVWMTLSEFHYWYQTHNIKNFLLPEKPQWINPLPKGSWHDSHQVYQQLSHMNSAQYIYCPSHHLFIVPNSWPAAAAKVYKADHLSR